MIVYSVQTLKAYKVMREQGFLEGNLELAMFPEAYQWMMAQMKKRVPNYKGDAAPIWLWQRRVNRNERFLLPTGTKGAILKLEIPRKDILWSSFDEWHNIINHFPFTYDETEWEEFEKRGFPEQEVKATWEKLFDTEWLASRPKEWAGNPQYIKWQGVTPRITMNQVQKVERFIAK
jgi:hypothetical protein